MTDILDTESLLLYLADELPPDRRQQLERRLADDGALRSQLQELGSAHQRVNDALAALDEATSPIHADAVARRVERVLRQELARPRPAQTRHTRSRRRIWSWVLPGAAAASVLMMAAIWIDRHVGVPNQFAAPLIQARQDQTRSSGPIDNVPAPGRIDRSESNFALWIDSFGQPTPLGIDPGSADLADSRPVDEDVHIRSPITRDEVSASQDPVSQYMLSSGPTPG